MARKKKEEQIEIKKPVKDFGTGWTGKNNKIQYELREDKRNE